MTTPNNENTPEPDPAWDYYIQYHTLIKAKSQLETLIMFIRKVETSTEHTQEILQQDLQEITNTLESI